MGLPIFESQDLFDAIAEGREITLDSARGIITVDGSSQEFKISPIPPFMEQLIADGGLMKHIAKK
jgi:3-isopropylmalate/(R)-2-methylmalate dehydratase small subunit